MQVNIIHLPERVDRLKTLLEELSIQGISDFQLWPGIIDETIPARGISKAHKQIVKYAKKEGLSEILIAEDDLKFTDSGAFDFFLKNKPENFDLYLSSVYYGIINNEQVVSDFAGLTLYIISKKFYDTFLNVPEYDNIDRMLANKGCYKVCNPFTVIQYNGWSDNLRCNCNYDWLLKEKELYKK